MTHQALVLLAVMFGAGGAQGEPGSKHDESHFAGVTERGDHGMGFSHERFLRFQIEDHRTGDSLAVGQG